MINLLHTLHLPIFCYFSMWGSWAFLLAFQQVEFHDINHHKFLYDCPLLIVSMLFLCKWPLLCVCYYFLLLFNMLKAMLKYYTWLKKLDIKSVGKNPTYKVRYMLKMSTWESPMFPTLTFPKSFFIAMILSEISYFWTPLQRTSDFESPSSKWWPAYQ
jgi:hypothetical protein